jgi:hypothetical protein
VPDDGVVVCVVEKYEVAPSPCLPSVSKTKGLNVCGTKSQVDETVRAVLSEPW